MVKKFLKSSLSIILCACLLTACEKHITYFDRADTVIVIAEQVMDLYLSGEISVGEKINCDNVSDYCSEDGELYKILNSDNEYQDYSAYMLEDDKVLVVTTVIFNSVEGYLMNFGNDKMGETYEAPEYLEFEDNLINLITVDNYPKLYAIMAEK